MTDVVKIEKSGKWHFGLRFSLIPFIFVYYYTLKFLRGCSKLRTQLVCTLRVFLANIETAILTEA